MVIGYRKKSFYRAHELLVRLRNERHNLTTLQDIQLLLIKEISRAEGQIRKHKAALKSLDGQTDAGRIRILQQRIESCRFANYIWRSFGDAVAFTFLDKFALKSTFYQTARKKPKADAGFLSDKAGFTQEFALMLDALKHNVPAILTDLTNTIRHGDLCLMGGSDPYLLEVKASPARNERARKQKASLEILQEFYETDGSERLWGNPNLRREVISSPEIGYVSQLSDLISMALSNGIAKTSPEEGLHYYAFKRKAALAKEVFAFEGMRAPWIFFWNDFVLRKEWMPYLPCTLSIADVDQLWSFIRGEIFVLVAVDTKRLEELVNELGFVGVFSQDQESHPLLIRFGPQEGGMWISEDMLGRIGMECASPKWLIESNIEAFRRGMLNEPPANLDDPSSFIEVGEEVRAMLQEIGMPADTRLVASRRSPKR